MLPNPLRQLDRMLILKEMVDYRVRECRRGEPVQYGAIGLQGLCVVWCLAPITSRLRADPASVVTTFPQAEPTRGVEYFLSSSEIHRR